MSIEKDYQHVEPPVYYEAVRKAARSLTDYQGIVFNSGRDGSEEFESLASGNEPTWPSYSEGREGLEVSFLSETGVVVTDSRSAVAALVISSAPTATVYFKDHFNQSVDTTEPPKATPYNPFAETIHQHPLMSNWQAKQIGN